jgi:hypothetical protein
MGKKKIIRCGDCGNTPRAIREELKSSRDWDLDSNGLLTGGNITSNRVPTGKLIALCDCGHMWRLKRMRNISEIDQSQECE